MNKNEKINELAGFFKNVTVFEDDKVTVYEKENGDTVVSKEVEFKNFEDFKSFNDAIWNMFKSNKN